MDVKRAIQVLEAGGFEVKDHGDGRYSVTWPRPPDGGARRQGLYGIESLCALAEGASGKEKEGPASVTRVSGNGAATNGNGSSSSGAETRVQYQPYRELAEQLVQRFPDELKAVPPLNTIAFVRDGSATPKSKGRPVRARVRKIPGAFHVLTDPVEFVIEVFKENLGDNWTQEQMVVEMYRALRHFSLKETKDGDERLAIEEMDVREWGEVAATLGVHWDQPMRSVPDILNPRFKWKAAPKQGVLPLDKVTVDASQSAPVDSSTGETTIN